VIRLLDPLQEHEFIPKSEQGNEGPLTFSVVPMTHGQFVSMANSANTLEDGGFAVRYDAILKKCIKWIANVQWVEGKPVKIDSAREVARFVDACGTPEGIGVLQEVFRFIQSLSIPTEDEQGN